jgi:xylulose-5-phosphate/fructose-6-phosphate phosphoketolase
MVNLIVIGKRDLPQYLTLSEAREQMTTGIKVWDKKEEEPDVTLAASGDYMTLECQAALKMLKEIAPEMKLRFVSVSEISNFNIGDLTKPDNSQEQTTDEYFGQNCPVLFVYHGYPEDIKQLLFSVKDQERYHVLGYSEKGTTTTPFDMLVLNGCSRYQLVVKVLELYLASGKEKTANIEAGIIKMNELLKKHESFTKENGKDMPEVTEFKLT